MAKKKSTKKKSAKKTTRKSSNSKPMKKDENQMTMAIVAFVLNFIVPGIGSLVAGKIKEGTWQLILTVIGAILAIALIGIPILAIAWVWGLVTAAKLIREAQ